MSYKFIDLFCGLGGFRVGLERSGFECVFSSDFDKHIQDTYEENFGERPFGDITKVDPNKIPEFDVLTAGFPCQPFSISGKKRGFEDTRGTLFFDICRILETKLPKVVILENVKHFIHHDKKRTLNTVLSSLQEFGYNISYKILNTKDFGLPQNRERIFIVGSLNNVFDFDQMQKTVSKPLEYFLEKSGNFEYLKKNEYTLIDNKLVVHQPSGLKFVGYRNKQGFKSGIRPNTEHLNRFHRQPNRVYSVEGYHPTIPSQESSGRFFIYLPKENRVRKLTLNECFRIMGFDDGYKKISSTGQLYRQIGNSVGVNITEELSRQIVLQGLLDESQRNPAKNKSKVINRQSQFTF
jgi:DNA (cytosine-5)-methyltransferase 1